MEQLMSLNKMRSLLITTPLLIAGTLIYGAAKYIVNKSRNTRVATIKYFTEYCIHTDEQAELA